MSAIIDGEVWAIEAKPIYINPGNNETANKDEYFRVKDIFNFNSINSLPSNRSGVFIPLREFSNLDGRNQEWLSRNRQRVVDSCLPIVRRVNNNWTIDLTLVNNVYDTATLIV